MKAVLLVEDDAGIALAFGIRLKSLGYAVQFARDATSAVARASQQHPDVVVLDITLPGSDGFAVADRLRQLEGIAATPIIFITASIRPSFRERAKLLGAAGYLEKPFDASLLAEALDAALSPRQMPTPGLLA
jgi:two-component system chemotaxis response regulator CheY